MASAVKPWVFKDAQDLVAAMRSKVNNLGYEITIGGSVLTKGESKNDLDLFLIPKQDGGNPLPVDLLMWIASKLGAGKTIVAAAQADPNARTGTQIRPPVFAHKMRFDLGGRKIDVFVI